MKATTNILLCALFIILLSTAIVTSHEVITQRFRGAMTDATPTTSEIAPRGEDVEDKLVFHQREDGAIALLTTHKQACEACHATIDTGIILLRRALSIPDDLDDDERMKHLQRHGMVHSASAKYNAQGILEWDSHNMADEICERAFGPLKPHYAMSCHRLIADFHQDLWKPFRHKDQYGDLLSDQSALQYKLDICHDTRFCFASHGLSDYSAPNLNNTSKRRTQCESCLELALDSRAILKRYLTTIPNPDNDPVITQKCQMHPNHYQGFVDTWCNSLGLRHYRPLALMELCYEIVNDSYDEFYAILKDGNKLHRMLKNLPIWEDIMCMKLSDSCTPDEKKKLYEMWDEASDFDFKMTQTRYSIQQIYEQKIRLLKDLEEEYYFSDKHMIYDEGSEVLQDLYPEQQQNDDVIDLDDGLGENNGDGDGDSEEHTLPHTEKSTQQDTADNDLETDGIFDELGRRLVGKLHYIDEASGKRIPNQLPPYLISEYKAARHAIIHDPFQQRVLEQLQDELKTLEEEQKKYKGKYRISPLPDMIHISPTVRELLADIIARSEEKEKGAIAKEYIDQTYKDQLSELRNSTHTQHLIDELHTLYDLDDPNIIDNEHSGVYDENLIIDNEDGDELPPPVHMHHKDEL